MATFGAICSPFLSRLVYKSGIISKFAAENLVPQAPVHGVLRIKRESGENPEQTRCCIFRQVVTQSFCVTVHHRVDGKAAWQWNEPEDLPSWTYCCFDSRGIGSDNQHNGNTDALMRWYRYYTWAAILATRQPPFPCFLFFFCAMGSRLLNKLDCVMCFLHHYNSWNLLYSNFLFFRWRSHAAPLLTPVRDKKLSKIMF